MKKIKVTKEMLEFWLGSDNTLEESLIVILEVANGIYTPEELRGDIISHTDFPVLEESEVVCVVCDGKGYLTDVYDTEAEETQIQRCDSCKQFESDEQAQEHVERVVESTLSDEEEKNLVKRLEQIEREQIIAWGLHRISGGFVKAEFDYVEDDRIYISLTDGVKSDCEDRVNISHCSLWRSNLEWTD